VLGWAVAPPSLAQVCKAPQVEDRRHDTDIMHCELQKEASVAYFSVRCLQCPTTLSSQLLPSDSRVVTICTTFFNKQ
jgi:hypothetical protein